VDRGAGPASPVDWAITANGHKALAANAPPERKKSRFFMSIFQKNPILLQMTTIRI
jgi:hypothetical protein